MNVHFSYRISKTSDLERLINQQVDKLGRYLRVFRPELVHLKGSVEDNTAREGVVVSLNLRLPSGQMAAQGSSPTAVAAIKATFDSLSEQVKKHKDLLRSHHKWPRRGSPGRTTIETLPFENTLAAMQPEHVSAGDISTFINVNLPRLQRSIQRELDYRESQGLLQPGQIAAEDVIGEAIADALSEQHDIPEPMKLEPWIHRLAIEAIDQLASESGTPTDVPLERSHGEQNVRASDEASLQFHQPDEQLSEEDVIPDPTANNPEELAARDELITLVEATLRDAGRNHAEAFILYAVEGFTLDEIAEMTNQSVEEVRLSIGQAREHLQRALPVKGPLKEKLVEYSRSA